MPVKRPVRLIASLLCATLISWTGALRADDDSAAQQSAEELARVRAQMDAMARSLEAARGEQDDLRASVEAAERKIAEAAALARKLSSAVDAQRVKVEQARADRAAAERRLAGQKSALREQLRAAFRISYGNGETGRSVMLLSQNDPERVGRMLAYYDYMNRARASSIAAIQAQVQQVVALEAGYQAELASLEDVEALHKRALAQVQAERDQRAAAMAKLSARIADQSQELQRLQGNEKQLRGLLDKLREARAERPFVSGAQKPFPEMKGKLPWPLRGPILAEYGDTKAGGKLQWKGLWIGAPSGTPVRAAAPGRVAYVGWLSSFGLIIVIEHDKGYFTLYGHNDSVAREAGDRVAGGEAIAVAGNTGGYEKPGLYFEVRKGTEPLDPEVWLMR